MTLVSSSRKRQAPQPPPTPTNKAISQIVSLDLRSRVQQPPFHSEPKSALGASLPSNRRSAQPSIASQHPLASNDEQFRGMAPGLPPVVPARPAGRDPIPASAESALRSASSPTAKRRSPSKSLLCQLLADRRLASWCRVFSRPARTERRSKASPGPRWLEYLKVGCADARTPCRAPVAEPVEPAAATLAFPLASAPAPAISAKDFPPHIPSRYRAVRCRPVRNGPSQRSESNSDASVRQLPSTGGVDLPHPPDRQEST